MATFVIVKCLAILLLTNVVVVMSYIIPNGACPHFTICVPQQDCPQDKVAKSHMLSQSSHGSNGRLLCALGPQLSGRGIGVCCHDKMTSDVNSKPENGVTSEDDLKRSAAGQDVDDASSFDLAEDISLGDSEEQSKFTRGLADGFTMFDDDDNSFDEAVDATQVVEPSRDDFSARAGEHGGEMEIAPRGSKYDKKAAKASKKYDDSMYKGADNYKADKGTSKYKADYGSSDSYKNYQEYQQAQMGKYGDDKYQQKKYGSSKYDDGDDSYDSYSNNNDGYSKYGDKADYGNYGDSKYSKKYDSSYKKYDGNYGSDGYSNNDGYSKYGDKADYSNYGDSKYSKKYDSSYKEYDGSYSSDSYQKYGGDSSYDMDSKYSDQKYQQYGSTSNKYDNDYEMDHYSKKAAKAAAKYNDKYGQSTSSYSSYDNSYNNKYQQQYGSTDDKYGYNNYDSDYKYNKYGQKYDDGDYKYNKYGQKYGSQYNSNKYSKYGQKYQNDYDGDDYSSYGGSYKKQKYYGSTEDMEQDPWSPFILGCVNACIYRKNDELYYVNPYYQSNNYGGSNSNRYYRSSSSSVSVKH